MDKKEIFDCCKFLYQKIVEEFPKLDDSFYCVENYTTETEETNKTGMLFINIKKLLSEEINNVLKIEYLTILNRFILVFKELSEFQKIQFTYESKNEIVYKKFFKEIFDIICYITNLFPIQDTNCEMTAEYPEYVKKMTLNELLKETSIQNNNLNRIQKKEILQFFRYFLLNIIARSFSLIYHYIKEFCPVFLDDKRVSHDKYMGVINQKKLDLLYEILHRPNINKLFENISIGSDLYFNDEVPKLTKINEVMRFGRFLAEISDNFVDFNESYCINACSIYFLMLFFYDSFNFMEDKNKEKLNKFVDYCFREVLINEIFNKSYEKEFENNKKNNIIDTVAYKFLRLIQGKNYASMYPMIYYENYFVMILLNKIKEDNELLYPKNIEKYYINRLLKYQNFEFFVESLCSDWDLKNQLLKQINERINISLEKFENSLNKANNNIKRYSNINKNYNMNRGSNMNSNYNINRNNNMNNNYNINRNNNMNNNYYMNRNSNMNNNYNMNRNNYINDNNNNINRNNNMNNNFNFNRNNNINNNNNINRNNNMNNSYNMNRSNYMNNSYNMSENDYI